MYVYFAWHEPSEMGYVGSTETTPERRLLKHLKNAREGRKSVLYDAMRASKLQGWNVCALEGFATREEMLWEEPTWICVMETFNPRIGFNRGIPTEEEILAAIKLGSFRVEASALEREARRRDGFKAIEKYGVEFFREAGRLGGVSQDGPANGKAGAEARWSQAGERERASQQGRASQAAWWGSLSEEQKEEYRRKCREGGMKGARLRHGS